MSDAKETATQWATRYFIVAKEKTQEAVGIVKKDLAVLKEAATQGVTKFSNVAHQGMNTAVQTVSSKITDDQKAWMISTASKVGALVSSLAYIPNRDDDDTEIIHYQKDFLEEDSKEFNQWKESFDLSEHIDECREIMKNESEVRKKYLEVVPHQMCSSEFWAKFFYVRFKVVKEQPKAEDNDPKVEDCDPKAEDCDLELGEEIDLGSIREEPELETKRELKEDDWVTWED